MQKPPTPIDEASRLESLYKLDVLDTPAEERFDRITRIAQFMFDVPIALISLVDKERQWSKSSAGLPAGETPRYDSFCAHAILQNETLFIPDTTKDERFFDNPFVVGEPYLRFYAGHILKSYDDHKIGTLCIMGPEPRELSQKEKLALRDLGLTTQDALQSLRHEDKDVQTGLYNRRGFLSVTEFMLANCKKLDCHASLIYFDLSNYQSYADSHDKSEELNLLNKFTSILKQTFRSEDILARVDHSRFVALAVHNKDVKVESFIERMKNQIHSLMTTVDEKQYLEFRSGIITSLPEYLENSGRLIDLVDKKMSGSEYSYVYEI